MNDEDKGSFMNSKWRPYMAVMYMIVCTCDFVLFPVLWSVLQAIDHGSISQQWNPITLQGAGLFHMAMGAVLGVAAWSRGQEKIAGVATSPTPPFQPAPQNYQPINTVSQAPVTQNISTGPATVGFGGKAAPPAAQEQLL